jgi:transaldolase
MTLLFSFAQAVACAEGQGAADLALRRAHPRLAQEKLGQGFRRPRMIQE